VPLAHTASLEVHVEATTTRAELDLDLDLDVVDVFCCLHDG
jgi:hypothetical protein